MYVPYQYLNDNVKPSGKFLIYSRSPGCFFSRKELKVLHRVLNQKGILIQSLWYEFNLIDLIGLQISKTLIAYHSKLSFQETY